MSVWRTNRHDHRYDRESHDVNNGGDLEPRQIDTTATGSGLKHLDDV